MYLLTHVDEEQGDSVFGVAHDSDTLMAHAQRVENSNAAEEDREPKTLNWVEELEGSDEWISQNIWPTYENYYRVQKVAVF